MNFFMNVVLFLTRGELLYECTECTRGELLYECSISYEG